MKNNKSNRKRKTNRMLIVFVLGLACLMGIISIGNKFSKSDAPKITKIMNETYMPQGMIVNPIWEEYEQLSDEEKSQWEVIPEQYVMEYQYEPQPMLFGGDELPSSYDLRAVEEDGTIKNYVTPVKNQGNLGLCLIFSTVASLESNILKTGLRPQNNPVIFAERQIDYVASNPNNNIPYNGSKPIQVYEENYNPYSTGKRLGGGMAFATVANYMALGFATQEATGMWSSYTTEHQTVNLNQIYSLKNYVVSEYLQYPILNMKTASENKKNAYVDMIKEHIMKYGAIAISTLAPDADSNACAVISNTNDGFRLVNVTEDCGSNAPEKYRHESAEHAMTIIGWNDDYEQSYCALYNEGKTDATLSEEECLESGGNYRIVNGAWIAKNSWGDSNQVNVGYYSTDWGFEGITKTIERDFDNYYDDNKSYSKLYDYENGNYYIDFIKTEQKEKLKRISFKLNTASHTNLKIYWLL